MWVGQAILQDGLVCFFNGFYGIFSQEIGLSDYEF